MTWDKKTNVKTIPLTIGIKKTKIIAISVLIIATIINYNIKNNTLLPSFITYFTTILLIINTDENKSDYYFYGAIDAMLCLQYILTIIQYANI